MTYEAVKWGSNVITSSFFTVNVSHIKLIPRAYISRELNKIINLFTYCSLN
jgi:hypothetical protein